MENTKRKSILIILFIFILIVAGLLYFLTNYNTDTKKKDTPKKDTPVSQTDKDIIIEINLRL